MRTALPIVFAAILFSSCYHYQYFTVASDNITPNEGKEFVYETDTLRVVYNFWGEKGPVAVTVYNKTNKALQVDWKRSAVIIGETSVGYYSPDLKINGEIKDNGVIRPRDSYTAGASLDATVVGSEGMGFIPPHSSVSRKNVQLVAGPIKFPYKKAENEMIKKEFTRKNIDKTSLTKDNSPLVFRSYLTFVMNENVFVTDHSFYVTGSFKTAVRPRKLQSEQGNTGNSFYVRRTAAFRTSAVIVASVLLVMGVAGIE